MKLRPRLSRRQEILLDCLLLFILAAVLVRPYFKVKYTDKWASIEATFISDARFLVAHWPHPQWQPLWYTGTRFDYVYPPALRYGTAIISKVTGFWPVKAYHFYIMFFYCLGIAGVYLLMRAAGRSRGAAYLGAGATALMSPSFLFLKNMRLDAGYWEPVRLGALVKYGEGPHITALCLLPIALAFTWRALESRRSGFVALAAIFCGAVVSNNFYGATSLAMFYPILIWSFWITRRDSGIMIPAIAIPVLSYGLTAFWLVPSYIRITTENMRYVSEHGNTWSLAVAIAVAIAFALVTWKWFRSRPERTWAVFVTGSVVFFSLNVLGNHFLNFRVAGEPGRLIPELDLVIILGVLLVLEWLWRRGGRVPRLAAAVVVAAAFATTWWYIENAWNMLPAWPDYKSRVEYRITDWLWKNMPDARVCSAGTVRFWFDAWHDLAELGGGSEQGLLNPVNEVAQWEISAGSATEPLVLWLQAMGVDAIYVAGPKSEEPYKDFQHQERFTTAATPLLFDDGQDNKLYRIPRRYSWRARVVDSRRLAAQKEPRFSGDVEYLRAYVDVIENGPTSPAPLARDGTDALVVRAKVDPGQAVLIQETFDPAWQAWSNGQRLSLRKDAMGFMVVDAPPGEHEIRLAFVTPLENRVGRALTAISILMLVGLILRRERAR